MAAPMSPEPPVINATLLFNVVVSMVFPQK
jgi:hypothetical protein